MWHTKGRKMYVVNIKLYIFNCACFNMLLFNVPLLALDYIHSIMYVMCGTLNFWYYIIEADARLPHQSWSK